MDRVESPIILSSCRNSQFIGRDAELARLASAPGASEGLVIYTEPGAGATELLFQAFDRLFNSGGHYIPIYFSFAEGETIAASSERFLSEMFTQIVAFRRRDPRLIKAGLSMRELLFKASAADRNIIKGLERFYGSDITGDDARKAVERIARAPVRARSAGLPLYLLIDNLHFLTGQANGRDLTESILSTLSFGEMPFAMSGCRRTLGSILEGRRVQLERLPFVSAARAVCRIAESLHVVINDRTADLITLQFDRDLSLISDFLRSAGERGVSLESFLNVQRHYTHEIFGGRIRQRFDRLLSVPPLTAAGRRSLLGSLSETPFQADTAEISIASPKKADDDKRSMEKIFDRLCDLEYCRRSSANVTIGPANHPFYDYVSARRRIESDDEPRALAFGRSLLTYLKRGPELMAANYRRRASIGLREVLENFAGQDIPLASIDHSVFSPEFKGAPDPELLRELAKSTDRFQLPKIAFSANTSTIYEPLDRVVETERSAIGFGFESDSSGTEKEIFWIAAEIDSKLEAAADHTEFWCDRLEMAGLMSGLSPCRIWLIAPEGFLPEAHDVLSSRNAIGSSRKQFDLMLSFLRDPGISSIKKEEYEITLPMDENAELIAANVAEEIARRNGFSPMAINNIKTALIEGIINAAEHSLSPDRKVHQQFVVDDRGFTVTITNRGLRLQDRAVEKPVSAKRRGWGLELIRRLMDEVVIEETDDGSRISMTKYLEKAASAAG